MTWQTSQHCNAYLKPWFFCNRCQVVDIDGWEQCIDALLNECLQSEAIAL
ncbi:MAG: hypothetical protein AAGA75_21645 [Cyanobacteria bacterium P01_E01_bin.6]